MRGRSNSLYRCRRFGESRLPWDVRSWTQVLGRETDTHKLNEQTELLNKLQSDYQGMKLLLQSYEGSLKAVGEEAKYVIVSSKPDLLLTRPEGAQ